MRSAPLTPYQSPITHEAISDIIRRHSSNKQDVRLAALQGLDLSTAKTVLDLGCGFGFMAEELAPRIAPDAMVTGIDACGDNERIFLNKVRAAGRDVRFLREDIGAELPFADDSFDLVVCSYSLYFFPEIIGAVARVLRGDGLFLVLTHSERSFLGLLRAVGIPTDDSALVSLIRRFSAENGAALLAPCFAELQSIPYRNLLHFHREDIADLITYLRFKLPLILPAAEAELGSSIDLVARAKSRLSRLGWVKVEKDDTAFLCRKPRCP